MMRILLCTMLSTLLYFGVGRIAIADINLQMAVASDSMHRGLSQTTHGPAYQIATHYQFDSGVFLGIWASSADFPRTDEVKAELDYFLGYQRRVSDKLAFDMTAVRYTYPSADLWRDYDWDEVQFTLYVGDQWALTGGVSDNWLGRSKKSRFFETNYRTPLPAKVTLDISVGYQLVEKLFGDDYGYAEIGISRPLGPLHARLAFSTTDQNAKDIFGHAAANRWFASLIWQV